jgi:hypothetical protein
MSAENNPFGFGFDSDATEDHTPGYKTLRTYRRELTEKYEARGDHEAVGQALGAPAARALANRNTLTDLRKGTLQTAIYCQDGTERVIPLTAEWYRKMNDGVANRVMIQGPATYTMPNGETVSGVIVVQPAPTPAATLRQRRRPQRDAADEAVSTLAAEGRLPHRITKAAVDMVHTRMKERGDKKVSDDTVERSLKAHHGSQQAQH